jgi:5-methylcytosine-specific restriction endonuclease McrA
MPKVWADRTPGTSEAPMIFSRPCLDCGRLVRGRSRCPACEATAYAATVLRPTGSRAAWTAIRNAVLATEPLCRLCGARAVTVDHLIPRIRGGDDRASNLRPLCHRCDVGVGGARANARTRVHPRNLQPPSSSYSLPPPQNPEEFSQ